MIKNWQKFNESIEKKSIEFTKEELDAFADYIKNDLMSWFSVKSRNELSEIIQNFLSIFNEEFDSNLSIDDASIEMVIIEPLTGDMPYDLRSFTGYISRTTMPGSQQICGVYLNSFWKNLKHHNYKPAFSVNLKIPFDEDLNQKRYVSYYNRVISDLNSIPNTTIKTEMGTRPPEWKRRSEKDYLPFNLFLRFEDFEFHDPFDKKNVIEFIKSNPKHINALYKWADQDEIFDFVNENPEIKDMLKGQNLLDFTKKYKSIHNKERSEMESENRMYVFIARPTFIEQSDGSYKKDIEIENLVPIDPYDSKDLYMLKMMKLRAISQSDKSGVYCIWLPNDFEDSYLQNINDDSMTKLRKLIDQKKEKI